MAEEASSNRKNITTFDIFLLGITIVIGGQVFSWNTILHAGFWEGFLSFFLTGTGYICLALCISEMTSALPFSGGTYGFVRVCIGPFFGYLIGCCETMENIAYVISAVIPLADMLTTVFETSSSFKPLYWMLFLCTSLFINIVGGKSFWFATRVLGIVSLLLIVLYIAFTAQYADYDRYSAVSRSFNFDGNSFMRYYPWASWFFIGVEVLPLLCVDCSKPQKQIPNAMMLCVIVLFITGIAIFFISALQYPGVAIVADTLLPLNRGYERFFHLNAPAGTWFALPSVFATGFGFMFIYGRQMNSMSRSGLFPQIFKLRTKVEETPFAALLFGTLITLGGIIVIYYVHEEYLEHVFAVCILAAYTIYIATFVSYCIFKFRYSGVPRHFTNPLNIYSALYGIGVFALGLISIVGFQENMGQIPLIIFLVYLTCLIVYYMFYGFRTQQLSEEEQKVMFRAYVINVNRKFKRQKTGKVRRHRDSLDFGSIYRNARSYLPELTSRSGASQSATLAAQTSRSLVIESSERSSSDVSSYVYQQQALLYLNPQKEIIQEEENETFPRENSIAEGNEQQDDDEVAESDIIERINSPTFSDEKVFHNIQENVELSRTMEDEVHELSNSVEKNPPEKSSFLFPFGFISRTSSNDENHKVSSKSSILSQHVDGNPRRKPSTHLLRASFVANISQTIHDAFTEMKIVPFMEEVSRKEYEAMLLAEARGKLSQRITSSPVGVFEQEEEEEDAKNRTERTNYPAQAGFHPENNNNKLDEFHRLIDISNDQSEKLHSNNPAAIIPEHLPPV